MSELCCFSQTCPYPKHGWVGINSKSVNKAGSQGSELPGFVLDGSSCVSWHLGFVNLWNGEWTHTVGAEQAEVLFPLSSGGAAHRHENIPAITLISQLPHFSWFCAVSPSFSAHWLSCCFSPFFPHPNSEFAIPQSCCFLSLSVIFLLVIQAVYLSASLSPHSSHYRLKSLFLAFLCTFTAELGPTFLNEWL